MYSSNWVKYKIFVSLDQKNNYERLLLSLQKKAARDLSVQFILRLVHVDLYWKAATNEHCIQEVDSYQIGLRTNQYVRHGDHFFLQTQSHNWAHFETTGALHSTKYSGYSMRRMEQYLPVRWTNQS